MLFQPIKPMLLDKSATPPIGPYIHQLKWDGFRCLLHIKDNKIKLYTRHQNDCTAQFAEFQGLKTATKSVLLDGEMIVLDDDGKPSFEAVMSRFQSRRKKGPAAHFAAFDMILIDGQSVTSLSIEERLALLQEAVIPSDLISVTPSYGDGQALFEAVRLQGLEGIVSKRKGSRYMLDYRSSDWLKTKNFQYATVTISGIRKGEFGWSLSLDGRYVGVCEFVPPAERSAFTRIAKQLVKGETKEWIQLEPLIQAKVKFQCWTKAGFMRSPSLVEFVV